MRCHPVRLQVQSNSLLCVFFAIDLADSPVSTAQRAFTFLPTDPVIVRRSKQMIFSRTDKASERTSCLSVGVAAETIRPSLHLILSFALSYLHLRLGEGTGHGNHFFVDKILPPARSQDSYETADKASAVPSPSPLP